MGYSIVRDTKGVQCHYVAPLTLEEVYCALVEILRDPDLDRLRYQIHNFGDLRGSCQPGIEMDELLAQLLGARYTNPYLKTAIVATDSSITDLAMQFRAKAKEGVEVFKQQDDAHRWLAVQ